MHYHTPKIENQTKLDGRVVGGIVRFVFRHLDLDGSKTVVRIGHGSRGAYKGRFYADARRHGGYVWDDNWNEWKRIEVKIPDGYRHLIVCRIAKPESFPRSNHVYDRRDSPGPWMIDSWKEALVCITAHEAYHLRQHLVPRSRNGGRFSEVDTEWAAKRIHDEWVAKQKKDC